MKLTASFRCAECADSSHVPPPTLPVLGAEVPGHWGTGAAAICPFGTLSPDVVSKTAPPNHAGPGSISTLPFSFLSNAVLNTLSFDIEPALISVSSSDAMRVQSGLVTLTVNVRRPVMSLAWHWLAHM
jgi:hypothetical protein